MAKQLQVKEETPKVLAIPMADFSDYEFEQVDTTDVLIPKILLMHGQSEKVLQGEKTQGELVRSTDWATLAPRGGQVEIIVFDIWKTWRVLELVDKKFEWRREEPLTPENSHLEWEFSEDGKAMRRDKVLNFYCVLATEAQAGTTFPLKISFSRTSFKAGQKIADGYARAIMDRQPPTRQTWKLGSEFVNGAKERYFVFTVQSGTATTPEQREAVSVWKKRINVAKKTNSIKDHDIDESAPTHQSATTEEF
jgi:hypothetical protein